MSHPAKTRPVVDGGRKPQNSNEVKSPAESSWPGRVRSHYDRILDLLRERGATGVLSSELYDNPQLYGRSPRNRVSEMRRDGFEIRTITVSASTVKYVLLHERVAVVQKNSITEDLPLFAEATR